MILVFVAGTDIFKHLSNISSCVVGVDRPIDKSIILYTLVLKLKRPSSGIMMDATIQEGLSLER